MGKEYTGSGEPVMDRSPGADTIIPPFHILVIRLSAMGDVAMTVPVLSALASQYPQLKITVLTKGFFGPIFNGLPNVSVYEADVRGRHKGVMGIWRLYKELRDLRIDAVADLHNVLRSSILKLYFKLGSVPFIQLDKGRNEKRSLTSISKKKFRQLRSTHQRYAHVFSRLGFPVSLDNVALPPKRPVSGTSLDLIGRTSKRWIGVAPFAAFGGKMYPLDLMEQVVNSLNETDEYRILLFGGGKEEQMELEKWDLLYNNCINLVDKIPFDEELAIISQLDLMIAMDSGNAHLAAMFGIPTITLWGVTHPYAGFYPFAQPMENALLADRDSYPLIPTSVYGNKYPPGYENAIRTIAPESVLLKVKEVLSS
ncbi:MAG TPA: glycosyltransferase family 9 protein [Arenibacter sp.]|nr:glycosyltransferase family 9 protein [Arenibacter sp.]